MTRVIHAHDIYRLSYNEHISLRFASSYNDDVLYKVRVHSVLVLFVFILFCPV